GNNARFPPSLASTGVEVIRPASGGAQHRPNVRRKPPPLLAPQPAPQKLSLSLPSPRAPRLTSREPSIRRGAHLLLASPRCLHGYVRQRLFLARFEPWRRLGGSSRNLKTAQIHASR